MVKWRRNITLVQSFLTLIIMCVDQLYETEANFVSFLFFSFVLFCWFLHSISLFFLLQIKNWCSTSIWWCHFGKGESRKKSNIHYPRLRPNKLGLTYFNLFYGPYCPSQAFPKFYIAFPFASAPNSHPKTLNFYLIHSFPLTFFTHQFLKFRFSMKCNSCMSALEFLFLIMDFNSH